MFYHYKVNYWDKLVEEEVFDAGLTFANGYAQAITNVEKDYGSDQVISITLTALDFDRCIGIDDIKDEFNIGN